MRGEKLVCEKTERWPPGKGSRQGRETTMAILRSGTSDVLSRRQEVNLKERLE